MLGFRLKLTHAPLRQTCETLAPWLLEKTQRQVSSGALHGSPFSPLVWWPYWQSLQVLHVSLPEHVPSPQVLQEPQSVEHVEQVSFPLQLPSPHEVHEPQSAEQVEQVSLPLQLPSPHEVHDPQSVGQLLQSSPPLHDPSPQQLWTEQADQLLQVLH